MLKITHIEKNTYKALCDANQLKLIDTIMDITDVTNTGNNRYTCEFKCRLDTGLTKVIMYLYRDEYEGLDYWQKYNIQCLIKNNRYIGGDKFVHNNKELSEKLSEYGDSWERDGIAAICQNLFYNTGDLVNNKIINEIINKKEKRNKAKFYNRLLPLSGFLQTVIHDRLQSKYYDTLHYITKDNLGNWAIQNYKNKFTKQERIFLYVNRKNEKKVTEFINTKKKQLETAQTVKKLQDIHTVEPWQGKARVMLLNLNTILSKYFGKDIVLSFDKNAPKINKQLKKYGIVPTQKENIAIGEFKKWLMCFNDTGSLYLDLDDFELPTINQIDRWAFQGSCHRIDGVGQNTSQALKEIGGYYYIRIYDYKKQAQARGYYKHVGYELAHAGMYSNFGNSSLNHTAYDAFSLILCALWGRKVDEFGAIEGNKLPERNQIWCNMSRLNDYITLGTSEILYNDMLDGEYLDDDEDSVYSEFEDTYITYQEIENGEYYYCDNVEDYVHCDNTAYSEYEECTLAIECYNVCDDAIYSEKLQDWFSSEETLLECAMG